MSSTPPIALPELVLTVQYPRWRWRVAGAVVAAIVMAPIAAMALLFLALSALPILPLLPVWLLMMRAPAAAQLPTRMHPPMAHGQFGRVAATGAA